MREVFIEKEPAGLNELMNSRKMKTREEVLSFGLSFPDTYQDSPFNLY